MCISFWEAEQQQLQIPKQEVNMKITIKSENINNKKGGEKKMKYSKTKLVLGAGIFVLTTVAFLSNTWATENVRQTKHNLSASRTIDDNLRFIATTEVGVFCHTLHV